MLHRDEAAVDPGGGPTDVTCLEGGAELLPASCAKRDARRLRAASVSSMISSDSDSSRSSELGARRANSPAEDSNCTSCALCGVRTTRLGVAAFVVPGDPIGRRPALLALRGMLGPGGDPTGLNMQVAARARLGRG